MMLTSITKKLTDVGTKIDTMT